MTRASETGYASVAVPTGKAHIVWLSALCALPVLTALLSLRPDGEFAVWQLYFRQFWLPAQVFEIATFIYAVSQGCSMQKLFQSCPRPVKLLLSLWFAALLLATALASVPGAALLSLISWAVHALFAASIWFLFDRWTGEWKSKLVDAMPLGCAIFATVIVAFIAFVGVGSDYDWVSSLPGFPHMRHSGYFLMPAMALSTGAIALLAGKRRHFHIVLLAVNFGFAIWIGSRGPLMAYAIMLPLAFLAFAALRNAKAIAAIALALGVGVLLSQTIPTPDHGSFNAIARVSASESGSVDKMSSGRTEIWRDTASAIARQPMLGHGGNQFRLQVPAAKETYNHPHNSVLQFAYEWGPVGALAMFALLALLALRLCRATFTNPEINLPLFLATTSVALFSLIDGLFYYNLPIMLFLTCAFGILVKGEGSRSQ